MKSIFKKIIPTLLAVSMLLGISASAQNFPDMPDDWTKQSIEKAVENGLLGGFEDGTIRPNNNITRAQMATIIVRSFGAETEADITKFTDMNPTDWHYSAFAKAVQMKAFGGDQFNHLNPNNYITFQECFKVISSVFGLIVIDDPRAGKVGLNNQDLTVLDKFEDGAEVSDWAKPYVAAVVANGYWAGLDGKLTPKAYITRAQFAVLMDNLVKTYITEPGTYSDFEDGNIMIKTENVTLKNVTTDDYIIIADGVKETKEGVNFVDCTVSGCLTMRGGGKNVNYKGFLQYLAVIGPELNINVNLSNLTGENGVIACIMDKTSTWSYTFGQ